MRLRIATILIRYGVDDYPEALSKLDDFYARQLPDVVRTTIIIDNRLPRTTLQTLGPDRFLIGGDNSYWEFSAWDRGLVLLERLRQSADLVHFVTSAFDRLYTDFISQVDQNLLQAATAAGAAVGHIDYYDEPVALGGESAQHWLRTSFFFLPPPAIIALRSMVSFEDAEAVFSDNPDQPFRVDSPLSTRFQEYIVGWLTGRGTGQGVTWHSHFELTGETLPYFRAKTLALLNEYLLTRRLEKLGYSVIDIGWLASQLATSVAASIDWELPWHDQLRNRS